MPLRIHTANDLNGHANDTASTAHFLIQCVDPEYGITLLIFGIAVPFAAQGLAYYFGKPTPVEWAYRLIIAVPLIITIAISVPQYIKIAQRLDDGNTQLRVVVGNGVSLAWVPRGPGWPDAGATWAEATEICSHLSEDGTTVLETEQNTWWLPTVDEAIRSLMLHGKNAGGVWHPASQTAVYALTPDKESPLWDEHSKVIYYWTSSLSTTVKTTAYIIVYNGTVASRCRTNRQDYLGFRAVKDITASVNGSAQLELE